MQPKPLLAFLLGGSHWRWCTPRWRRFSPSRYFGGPGTWRRQRTCCLAVKGTVGRAFWRGQVPAGSVKLDLYRLREPKLGVGIWVPDSVLDAVLKSTGIDNPMLLTVRGQAYVADLPEQIITGAPIPAMVLEVYCVTDKLSSYKPDPRFLALSDWFLRLG